MVIAYKIVQLYFTKVHNIKKLDKGLDLILYSSIFTTLVGVMLYILKGYLNLVDLIEKFSVTGYIPQDFYHSLIDWQLTGTAVLILSIFSSTTGAIAWIFIKQRVTKIIFDEAKLALL
jgi:hypothetical protein